MGQKRLSSEERRRRKVQRWFKNLPPEKRVQLTQVEINKLVAEGSCNLDGSLTGAGELRLHQLELLEWWVTKGAPRRKAAAEAREASKERQ